MGKTNEIDKYLNSTYQEDIAFLPRKIKDDETDDFIAWKLGRKVIKASTNFCRQKHVAAMRRGNFNRQHTCNNVDHLKK